MKLIYGKLFKENFAFLFVIKTQKKLFDTKFTVDFHNES